jgi:hypothetical protein
MVHLKRTDIVKYCVVRGVKIGQKWEKAMERASSYGIEIRKVPRTVR